MIDIDSEYDEIKRRENEAVHAMFILTLLTDPSSDDDLSLTLDLAEHGKTINEVFKCGFKF